MSKFGSRKILKTIFLLGGLSFCSLPGAVAGLFESFIRADSLLPIKRLVQMAEDKVKRREEMGPLNFHARDEESGYTPLIVAIEKDRESIVRFLLEKDVDLKVTSANGKMALELAVEWGKEGMARLLIERGALKFLDKNKALQLQSLAKKLKLASVEEEIKRYLSKLKYVPEKEISFQGGSRFGSLESDSSCFSESASAPIARLVKKIDIPLKKVAEANRVLPPINPPIRGKLPAGMDDIWESYERGQYSLAHEYEMALEEFLKKSPILRNEDMIKIKDHQQRNQAKVGVDQHLIIGSSINQTSLVSFENNIQGVFKPDEGMAWNASLKVTGRYKNEIAAYLLDRLLGLNKVPMTVERTIGGKVGSLQLFIPNSSSGNKIYEDLKLQNPHDYRNLFGPYSPDADMEFFDYWTNNCDRVRIADVEEETIDKNGKIYRSKRESVKINMENYLIHQTKKGEEKQVAIDQDWAFFWDDCAKYFKGHAPRFRRWPSTRLLEKLKVDLTPDILKKHLGPWLSGAQLKRLVETREKILQLAKQNGRI